MKKLIYTICIIGAIFLLTGCGEKNIEGSLSDIMEKLYAGIKEDEMPMMTENVELDKDMLKGYFNEGSNVDIKYKEVLASESMIGSMAHTVVLFRLENASDAKDVVKEIEAKVDYPLLKQTKEVFLTQEDRVVLKKAVQDIEQILESEKIPKKLNEKICKKCAYYDLCYI